MLKRTCRLALFGAALLAACTSPSEPDTGRGGGVSRQLSNPAWVILLDHHQDQYPSQWAYVFSAERLEDCRMETSYSESDLNLAPRSQYEGEVLEAKSLSDVRRGRERPGSIVKLVRVSE